MKNPSSQSQISLYAIIQTVYDFTELNKTQFEVYKIDIKIKMHITLTYKRKIDTYLKFASYTTCCY